MRICLYTSTALPKLGGQETVVDGLARTLARRGHHVTVLAPTPRARDAQGPDPDPSYRTVRHPRFVSTTWFVGAYGRFLRDADRAAGGFDLVHCHDTYPTGWIAVREALAPVVITSHGGDLNPGNVRIVKPGVEARCRTALAGAQLLIAIGRFTHANYQRVAGSQLDLSGKIVHIPNGIDLPLQHPPAPEDAPDGRPYLLYLGRLHCRKGVDCLLHALAVRPECRLQIVGDGPERARLEALHHQLALGDRVRFLGRRTGDDKARLLHGARAVVMPSLTWEAFPVVVLEAAAAGKPVIASRVPGLEDLIADGQTGRLLPPGDAAAWAKALGQVWADESLARTWGRQARSQVHRYAWDTVAAEHEAAYERACRAT